MNILVVLALCATPEFTLAPNISFVPDMILTPTSVRYGDGQLIPGSPNEYTLVWALNNTGEEYGRKILLRKGLYPSFQFDANAAVWQNRVRRLGSKHDAKVIILGEDGATIDRISDQWGSTIGVLGHGSGHSLHYIHWENIKFECNGDAAFLIGSSADLVNGGGYKGWSFEGCEIDGGYDWYTGTGRNSKWGILTWAVSDFRFNNGYIHDIKREHAFYLHNNLGDVMMNHNIVERCGRTFCQITARKEEFGVGPLPENPGDISVCGNLISDVTLGDGCEGGTAITLTGRNRGLMMIRRNTILFGHDQELRDALADQGVCVPEPDGSRPIGNGAIVAWTTGSEDFESSLGMVVIRNVIWYAPGAGRIGATFFGALDILWASGNVIIMGRHHSAMRIGNDTIQHRIPGIFVMKNNLFMDGDLAVNSLADHHCVMNNHYMNADFYVGGGRWDGGQLESEPICDGFGCNYCN